MKKKFLEFLRDESGQTSTEYILLVVIVAVLVMKVGGQLKTRLSGLVDAVFDGDQIKQLTDGNF